MVPRDLATIKAARSISVLVMERMLVVVVIIVVLCYKVKSFDNKVVNHLYSVR